MKNVFLFCCLYFITTIGFCQTQNATFPDDFVGVYKGKLQIFSPRGTQEIPMEFHLKKTDSVHKFKYVLVYNGQPRNYTLVVKDQKKGIYAVDENNGIILPTKFANNTLFSFFEVQGNLLSSRLAFSKTELDFEILFTAVKNKVKTGGVSKEIPEVFGYPISVVQKAVLQKQ